ncbi:MAG: glutathione peroxidase [[Candidatus Thermochlorobacteriaceae] bacterium GBChlB]|nr:MAG: glutathione peroxidase [[Candidatus Thermochlorobacteriaceae] bacterium GBChlB]
MNIDFDFKTITGEPKKFSDYKGNALLIVNVASKCGYTPQYAGLEKLHETYEPKGLKVVGFPCNQFGGQEPGTEEEILSFCTSNYGVKFDMMSKIDVKGAAQHPLYKWLTTNAMPAGDVKWNFEKFLVDRSGNIVARFESGVAPDSERLKREVEKVLA